MSQALKSLMSVAVAAGMLGLVSFVSTVSVAQTRPQPAAKPPAAQPAKPPAVKPREVTGVTLGWIKHCAEVGTPPALSCVTQQETRSEGGDFLSSLAYQEPPGGARKLLAVGVPLGTWLPNEMSLRIDQGKPVEVKYGTCFSNGCFGALTMTPELLQLMRTGKTVVISLSDADSLPVEVSLPLESFAKALDGDPADVAASEEFHRQWISDLQSRARARAANSLAAPPAAQPNGTPAAQPPAPSSIPPKN